MAAVATTNTRISYDDITDMMVTNITKEGDNFTSEQKQFIKQGLEKNYYTYRYHETDGPMDWFDNMLDFSIPEHKGIIAYIWISNVFNTLKCYHADYSATKHSDIVHRQMSNIIRYLIVTKHTSNEVVSDGSPTNIVEETCEKSITNKFITNRLHFTDEDKSFMLDAFRTCGFKYKYYPGGDPMMWFSNIVEFEIPEHQGILAGMWFSYVAYGTGAYNGSDNDAEFNTVMSIQMKCYLTMLLSTEAFHKALRYYGIIYHGY